MSPAVSASHDIAVKADPSNELSRVDQSDADQMGGHERVTGKDPADQSERRAG